MAPSKLDPVISASREDGAGGFYRHPANDENVLRMPLWQRRFVVAATAHRSLLMVDHYEDEGRAQVALAESFDQRPLSVVPGLVWQTPGGRVRLWMVGKPVTAFDAVSGSSDIREQVLSLLATGGWMSGGMYLARKTFNTPVGDLEASVWLKDFGATENIVVLHGVYFHEVHNVLESVYVFLERDLWHGELEYRVRRFMREVQEKIRATTAAQVKHQA